jgi:hypothetical protein
MKSAMEGIAITHDAYAAIAAALPQGVEARPVEPAAAGKVFVWLDGSLADCLAALRRRGEDHSDVILRLAAVENEDAWHAAVRPERDFIASALGRRLGTLELEIDDSERRANERSLTELCHAGKGDILELNLTNA